MRDPAGDAASGGLLISYDGSDGARRVIGVTASLFPGHEALVLAVASPVTPGEALAETVGAVEGYEELNLSLALETATDGAELAHRSGLIARARAEIAVPTWQGILDVAEAIGASVIVMGSHGRTRGRELLERSVSHQVAEHAHRPVIIVPPPRR